MERGARVTFSLMSSYFSFSFPLMRTFLIEGFSTTIKMISFPWAVDLISTCTSLKNPSPKMDRRSSRTWSMENGRPSRLLIAARTTPSSTFAFPRMVIF